MNRKHTICYTLATFCACQRHQNIDIWVSKINTFEIPPNLAPSCRTQTPGILTHAAKNPDPCCQDIKIPSRARPFPPLPTLQACCLRPPKSSILRPTQRHAVMNRKHTICYTLDTFRECQRHQNIDIWVSSTQHTAHSTQHTAHSTQHTARW